MEGLQNRNFDLYFLNCKILTIIIVKIERSQALTYNVIHPYLEHPLI